MCLVCLLDKVSLLDLLPNFVIYILCTAHYWSSFLQSAVQATCKPCNLNTPMLMFYTAALRFSHHTSLHTQYKSVLQTCFFLLQKITKHTTSLGQKGYMGTDASRSIIRHMMKLFSWWICKETADLNPPRKKWEIGKDCGILPELSCRIQRVLHWCIDVAPPHCREKQTASWPSLPAISQMPLTWFFAGGMG